MKKKIVLGMAAIMLLGSIRALASDTAIEITEGKIAAVSAESEIASIRELLNEMARLQVEAAEQGGDSSGLVSAIGQTAEVAEDMLKMAGRDEAKLRQLNLDLRTQLSKMKEADERNQIRGIRIQEDLKM